MSIAPVGTVHHQYLRIDTQEIETTIWYPKETDTFVIFVDEKIPTDIVRFHASSRSSESSDEIDITDTDDEGIVIVGIGD